MMFGTNDGLLMRQRITLLLVAALPLLTLALLVTGACSDSVEEAAESGQTQEASQPPPSAPPTSTAATQPPGEPTATPVDVYGWPTYKSDKWGYEIRYPPGWYDLPNFGAPDTAKYFANQDVSDPLQMTKGGVWLTIEVASNPYPSCASANLQFGTVIGQQAIEISGKSPTRYVLEDEPLVVLNLQAGDLCYLFLFSIFEPGTRDANLPLIDAMLETFKIQ